MEKYYGEEIEKDTAYRREYLDGIECFIEEAFSKAKGKRSGFITPEKYAADPEFFRSRLREMFGFPISGNAIETPMLVGKNFVAQDGNVSIFRMQLCFFGKLKVYGIYFEQKDRNSETPFLLGLHGGEGTPELVSSIHMNSANYNHLVRRITDRGADVFVPQLLLWNLDHYGGKKYERDKIDGALRQLGGSITALELYFLSGCISYFIENEGANKDRIGVAGLSYGGMYALHLAAVDTRIKACFSCSWFHSLSRVVRSDWSYFRAAETFFAAEVAALVAPRALCVGMGSADELFSAEDTLKEAERVKPYYAAVGAEDNFLAYVFDGKHETDKSDRGIDFLFEHLNRTNGI